MVDEWVNLFLDTLVSSYTTESVEPVRLGGSVLENDDLYRGFYYACFKVRIIKVKF